MNYKNNNNYTSRTNRRLKSVDIQVNIEITLPKINLAAQKFSPQINIQIHVMGSILIVN